MKRIMIILAALSVGLAAAVWGVLLGAVPQALSELSEEVAAGLYFAAAFALLAGTAVALFGDRCIQFFGAVSAVVAFLGLAALHSTHTHNERLAEDAGKTKGAIAETTLVRNGD